MSFIDLELLRLLKPFASQKTLSVMSKLQSHNFQINRSIYGPQYIETNATVSDILDIFRAEFRFRVRKELLEKGHGDNFIDFSKSEIYRNLEKRNLQAARIMSKNITKRYGYAPMSALDTNHSYKPTILKHPKPSPKNQTDSED